MADVYRVTATTLSAIADAIRSKTGETDPIVVKNFSSEIESISGGGGAYDNLVAGIAIGAVVIAGTTPGVAVRIGHGVNDGITALSLPDYSGASDDVLSVIGGTMPAALESISMPQIETFGVGHSTIGRTLENLKTFVLPKVTTLTSYAFAGTGIEEVTDDLLPQLSGLVSNDGLWKDCASLRSVSLSRVTGWDGKAIFYMCRALESLTMPELTAVSSQMCSTCTNLTSVSLPACTSVASSAFLSCTLLRSLSAPLKRIDGAAFANSGLETLELTGTTVCRLLNVSAFSGTPIKSGAGRILVNSDLVDAYKTATNWSTYADYISAREV